MDQDKIIPDAIVLFSGGIVPLGEGKWRTTTYDDGDAFGTLGGRDRVEAAAELAKQYPSAYVITTSHQMTGELPTLARVYADELRALGIAPERILEEEHSTSTATVVQQSLQLAHHKGWKRILFVSCGYHLPRIEAFLEQTKSDIDATFVSSESVLVQIDSAFAKRFEQIQKTAAYQSRLAAEVRGIKAIKSGTYHFAPVEDKKERPV